MNFVYCEYPIVLKWLLSAKKVFLPEDFAGTIVGAPVVPVMLTIFWPKLTKRAVLLGSMGGTSLAIMAWLLTCRFYYGIINVETLVNNYSSLAGSVTSLGSGAVIAFVLSMIRPDNYDFTGTQSSEYS